MLEILPIAKSLLRNKMAALLIILQLALTIAIVSNALFFINQRIDKINRPTGMAVNEIIKVSMRKIDSNADEIFIIKRDMDVLRAMPEVINATPSMNVPLSGGGSSGGFQAIAGEGQSSISGNIFQITEHGIETFGMKLIKGRNFHTDEVKYINQSSIPDSTVIIVTQKFAGEMFPEEPALGKTIFIQGGIPAIIVGIVDHMMGSWPHRDNIGSIVFLPVAFTGEGSTNYLIRTGEKNRDATMLNIVEKLRAIDNSRLIMDEKTLETIKAETYSGDYAMIKILSIVVFMLVFVNALGIVGLTTFWVNQRRKQIGIRRALGATKAAITRYFIVENSILCIIAGVTGGGLALFASSYMVRNYSLALLPWQYVPITGACILLLTVLAALIPAWRAAQISPAVATA